EKITAASPGCSPLSVPAILPGFSTGLAGTIEGTVPAALVITSAKALKLTKKGLAALLPSTIRLLSFSVSILAAASRSRPRTRSTTSATAVVKGVTSTSGTCSADSTEKTDLTTAPGT